MSERSGIEIDYCPDCRGVWLDRGELDKILERVASQPEAPPPPAAAPPRSDDRRYEQPRYDDRGYDDQRYDNRGYDNRGYDNRGYDNRGYDKGYPRKKKREHWLTELFD